MTVVVADTSPLNYLVLIEAIDLLPTLYGRVVVPEPVLAEFARWRRSKSCSKLGNAPAGMD
jgi:predicted nucleic acid-binding protein